MVGRDPYENICQSMVSIFVDETIWPVSILPLTCLGNQFALHNNGNFLRLHSSGKCEKESIAN